MYRCNECKYEFEGFSDCPNCESEDVYPVPNNIDHAGSGKPIQFFRLVSDGKYLRDKIKRFKKSHG